jgi:hypothetical protein
MDPLQDDQNEIVPPSPKRYKKAPPEPFVLPTIKNFGVIYSAKYSLPDLKAIAKHFKLKVTGNKPEIFKRVEEFLKGSFFAVKIQRIIRGFLLRKAIRLCGPGFRTRKLCVNDNDFVTLEPLDEIPFDQFVSYKDQDEFTYGFDIVSLYNMAKQNPEKILNPYTRRSFPTSFIANMQDYVRLRKAIGRPLDVELPKEPVPLSLAQQLEQRAVNLFQIINGFGHYSDSRWLMNLSQSLKCRYVLELMEIWNYRSQLTNEVKRQICPPNGSPFANINILSRNYDINDVKKHTLDIVEKLITRANNLDQQNLGAFYVLGALTLISEEAAISMPWLQHSFM